jgi:hypothetical protein
MREGGSMLVLREMPESLQGLMGGQLELVWHGQDGDSILSFDGVAQVKHGEHVEDHLVPGKVSGEGPPCELPAGQSAVVAEGLSWPSPGW